MAEEWSRDTQLVILGRRRTGLDQDNVLEIPETHYLFHLLRFKLGYISTINNGNNKVPGASRLSTKPYLR